MKNMVRFVVLLVLGLFPLVAFAEKRPNIIFVMADDLNDFIGVMNNATGVKTPNIDRLARHATIFMNAHSNAPVCSPSRASLFSGIYPHQSGQYGFGNWRKNEMLANSNTIMEMLTKHGYYTAGAGKLLHNQAPVWDEFTLRPDYTPLAYNGKKTVQHPDVPSPFNKEIGPLDSTFIPLSHVPHVKAGKGFPGYKGWWYGGWRKPFRYASESDRSLLPDEIYANWAVAKIKQWERKPLGKPFFLAVGFIRPHTPLVVPDKYFRMYPKHRITLPEFLPNDEDDTHFEEVWDRRSKGRKHYEVLMESFDSKEEALRTYYQAYLASISFMDELVGQILDAVEDSRYRDNTIIVFTSDHGYHLGEKRYLFKNNLWERSTKVPLIIYDPRRKRQKRVGEAVSLIDLYPTFMEFAGVRGETRKNEKGGRLDGRSLVPLITGRDRGERLALTVVRAWGKRAKPSYAIRVQDWRYILYGTGRDELYYHPSDPKEERNLAEVREYQGVRKKLKRKLLSITTK